MHLVKSSFFNKKERMPLIKSVFLQKVANALTGINMSCRSTATVLPQYCRSIAAVLLQYCRSTAAALPPYCCSIAVVLQQ